MTHEDAFRVAFDHLQRYEIYRLLRALSVLVVYLGFGFYLTSPGVLGALAKYLEMVFEWLELPCYYENTCFQAAYFLAVHIQLAIFVVFVLVFVILIFPTVRSLTKPSTKLHVMLPQRLGFSVSLVLFFTTFHNFIIAQLYWQFYYRVLEVWGYIPVGIPQPYYNNPILVPVYIALASYMLVSTVILSGFFWPVLGVIWTMRVLHRAIPKSDFPELRKLRNALIVLGVIHISIYICFGLISGPLYWIVTEVPKLMQFIQGYLLLILFNILFGVTLSVYIITGWDLLKRADLVLEGPFSKKGFDSEGFDESGEPLPEW